MTTNSTTAREQRVRERAHRLWEEAGRPEGRDNEFWNRAELEIGIEDNPGRNHERSPGGPGDPEPPARG